MDISIYTDFGTMLAAFAGCYIAHKSLSAVIEQLKAMNDQNKITQHNAFLFLEQDMDGRRARFLDIARTVGTMPPDLAKAMRNEALESYLNSVDRLASSIIHGLFTHPKMKSDYYEYLTDIVRDHPAHFVAGTRYRNIKELHETWAKEV